MEKIVVGNNKKKKKTKKKQKKRYDSICWWTEKGKREREREIYREEYADILT